MTQIATVVAIKGSGTAYAISAGGKSRVLKVGDVLQKGETVRTTGDTVVQLLMIDGAILTLAPGQSVLLNEQVVDTGSRPTAADSAVTTPEAIQAIIDALRAGVDLSDVLDAAAAGLAGAGGNDAGHTFVRLPRIVEGVEPLQFEYGFRAQPALETVRQVTIGTLGPQASLSVSGGLVVDETSDLNVARSAQLVNVSAATGEDADGATVNVELVIDQADSGLTTTAGQAITLVRGATDNEVVGMYDSNGDGVPDAIAFTVSISDDGVVTVNQRVSLRHPDAATLVDGDTSSYDEAVSLAGRLSVRVTVVDGDGDVATATQAIGDRINFEDDGPMVDVSGAAGVDVPMLTTQDQDTIGDASDVATSAVSFATLFTVSGDAGADQDGSTQSVSFALSLGPIATSTGLTSHGAPITLMMDGGEIVGRAVSGDTAVDVFRIRVDASGNITLTQHAQVDHLPEDVDASNDNNVIRLPAGSVVLTATASVTDGDQDKVVDSQALDISVAFGFEDDVPSVTANAVNDAGILLTTQDAETIGNASDTASASFAAAFLAAAAPVYGADGPGSTTISGYGLAVLNADSALTSNGLAITLAMEGADVVGSTTAGAVFRISVNGSGTVTLTQYAQIDHLPEDIDDTNDNNIVALVSGRVILSATATTVDFDNDTATATVSVDLGGNLSFDNANIRFEDDVPNVTVGVVADGQIVMITQDAETPAAASDSSSASFGAAFEAAVTPDYGADIPGSTTVSGYTLAVIGTTSNLTSNGEVITLAMDGADVVGSTSAGAVFRISVDESGTVTLTQYAQIDHLPEDVDATNDDANVVLGSGLVTLSATATVVDFDNDTATATVSVDLGGNVSFDDDVPNVTANAVDDAFVLVTQDAETIGAASDTASASFAAAFLTATSPVYGADGPGSATIGGYSLAIVSANSGMTSNGQAITLAMDGADVVGSTATGAVFRINVDGSGTVTLTQYAQIDHLPEDVDASNDNANLALGNGLVTLSATVTAIDFDNDTTTATVTVDLGGNVSFDDDVPSVTSNAVAEGAIVLVTRDAQTIGAASDTASASFAAAFLTVASPVYGADGPGSTTISGYSLAALSADSGMTSNGLAITLSMEGADVVGSTTSGAVFRISVDSSGTVTLTQYAQIDHLPEDVDATNENANVALGNGLVTLSATATTIDFDNDTATATVSVDLGGNVSFDDDVPSVTAGAVTDGSITLTTRDAQTIGAASDTASASFATAFLAAASPVYGADGPGSTTISGYSLAIVSANSGLTSNGHAITLSMEGADVVGSTTSGAIFRISVDGSGTVTLTQYAQVDHLPEDIDATNDNSNVALGNGLVTLNATATTIDFDNDMATGTVSVDLGGNLSFDDDVPSVTAGTVGDSAIVLTTQDAQTIGTASDTATGDFAAAFMAAATPNYGADGPGSTTISAYTLAIISAAAGLTSNGLAITLAMDGADVVGSTTAGAVFRISVNGAGTVTLTQYAQIDHLPEDIDATNDNTNVALGNGLVTLSATATTIDFDNDTSTATMMVDLGGNISFDDDAPVVLAETNLIYANANNPSPGGTGVFDYSVGGDSRTSFSASNSDFSAITLSGFVGTAAISSQSVTWVSEDANQAVFDVQFSYAPNPLTPGLLSQANGTLTFDKVAGTYTLTLDQPIDSFSILATSGTLSKESYNLVGSSAAQPEIVVSKLADQFYVRFTGGEEQGGGGIEFKSSDGTTAFNNGETIVGAQAWVSISGSANGVASDTLQAGEVLNMDFYTSSPGSAATPGPGTATSDGIFLKLDQLGASEDFVVILKLVDPDNSAITTTKAIVVDSADIFLSSESNPYGITFVDGSDGVVIIESNDYNSGGSNWLINGAQLLTSTESVTGSGIDLNRATGTSGGSSGTETFGGDTVDSDVIKISDIGFISTTTSTQHTSLTFSFHLIDADNDTTATQTLTVDIVAGSTFTGTSSAESIQGGAGNDTMTGGGGADIFQWTLGDQGTTATPAVDQINDFIVGSGGDALDLRDLIQGEVSGTDLAAATSLDQYLNFTEVGGNAVLQVDHDGGSFAPTQTITFDSMTLAELTTGLGLSSPATDLQIIQQMLAQDNLKNSA